MKKTLRAGSSSHVKSAKPAKSFGNPARLAVDSADAFAFLWFSLAGIPDEAVVTSAELTINQDGAWPAPAVSRTLTARPTKDWKADELTFDGQPDLRTGEAVATKTVATPDQEPWVLDVATIAQSMITGTDRWRGFFRIHSDDATIRHLRGFKADTASPELVIEYELATPAPEDLTPDGGAVGTRTPVLAWPAIDGETGHQVQISTDPAFAAIEFDSGLLADPEPRLDLATTAYLLPADGSHRYWRVLRQGPLGLSDPSDAAEIWYVAHLVVTITSPTGPTSDAEPDITWTVTGGIQTAYRVRVLEAKGRLVWTSKLRAGATTTVSPDEGASKVGDAFTVEVRAFDDEPRVVSSGDHLYASDTATYTFNPAGAATPPTGLQVTQPDPRAPWALLTWQHAGTPAWWAVFRDDRRIAMLDPADVAAGAGESQWFDYSASALTEHTWRVEAVAEVAGRREIGTGGPEDTFSPTIGGMFLVDPATGEDVMIFARDELEGGYTSQVVLSSPLDTGRDVVRELALHGLSDTLSGYLTSAAGRDVDVDYERLMAFKVDRGRNLRAAVAQLNIPVAVHSVTALPIRAGAQALKRWRVSCGIVQQGQNPWSN